MIRLLFIARYRDPTMDRKLVLMAQNGELLIRQIRPSVWRDPLLSVRQESITGQALEQLALPLIGRPDDPHRAFYRTLDFGMRAFRPHIIHAEEEPDSLAALQIALARRCFAPRAKLILYTWQNIDRPRAWPVRLVMSLTLRAAEAILCANREAEAILRQKGYQGLTQVIPAIGVDTQTFSPCPAKPPEHPFTIGYIGRLVPEKGVETLIDAVATLGPEARLLIIGGGPHRQALEERARNVGLGNQVRFDPPIPPAEVARRLCELDVLVLPSRTTYVWKEQFGRVLAEAMACKVPVIGSDSGAIPEVIGDAGLIFPEGDAKGLAERLRQLMISSELRQELAERGYMRAITLYSQEQIARRTADFYRLLYDG